MEKCKEVGDQVVADQVVELKDDRSLFAHTLTVARSRPEMNLKDSIGEHEFTSLPQALFTVSGEVLPCTDKSKLMAVLEDLPNKIIVDLQPEDDIIPLTPRNATVTVSYTHLTLPTILRV